MYMALAHLNNHHHQQQQSLNHASQEQNILKRKVDQFYASHSVHYDSITTM